MRAYTLIEVVAWFDVELGKVGLFAHIKTGIVLGEFVNFLSYWLLRWLGNLLSLTFSQGCFVWNGPWLLLVHLAGDLFGPEDLVKDIGLFFQSLLVPKHLALVDSKEQFHIKTVNVLQQVLIHRIARLSKCHQSEEAILALQLSPVRISVTTRLRSVQHLVLLVLQEELLPLVEKGSAQQLAPPS